MSARGKSPVAKPYRKCACGCGGNTRGEFMPGHAGTHRKLLVEHATQNTYGALRIVSIDELRTRGWLWALDPITYPKPAKSETPKRIRSASTDPLQAARLRLEGAGRYGRSAGERKILLTSATAETILAMSDAELNG